MNALEAAPGLESVGNLRRGPLAFIRLALIATTLIAGCASAPTPSQSVLDADADFSAYRTYTWHWLAGADDSDATMSLMDARIRSAIADEMRQKGYVEAPAGDDADLKIDYEAASAEKLKNNPFRIGIGIGSYGSHGGASVGTSTPSVRNVTEGSLVVHVIDTARNSEVWRSRISRELEKGNVDPEVVRSIVAEVFTDFPARAAAP